MLASDKAIEEKLHPHYRTVSDLEDDPAVPRGSYMAPESMGDAKGGLIGGLTYLGGLSAAGFVAASGGTLIAVASAGIVAGTLGVAICSVLAASLSKEHTKHVKEHLLHSGLLLWVRTWDREHERRAVEILSKHGADDVHLHKIS